MSVAMNAMPFSDRRWSVVARAVAAAAVVLASVWLWACFCIFPLRSWNDIRLAPSFAPRLGMSIYPGVDGPASTWMYGPLPVWLNAAATLAPGPGEALLVAGAINILVTLGPLLAVCFLWPTGPLASPGVAARAAAAALAVAIMPWATWQFLQADNYAIGFGLFANLLLVRARGRSGLWAAAIVATAAVMCKQTSLAVPLSQVVWLWGTAGPTAAVLHVGRLAAAGIGWLAVLVLGCDPARMWYTAVLTPGGLPWTDDFRHRFLQMLPHFATHAALPAAAWLWLRRSGQSAPLALPTIAWLLAWPLGAMSVFKTGGTNNCLQGLPLWLPAAAVMIAAALARRVGPARATLLLSLVASVLLVGRIATRDARIWRPHIEAYPEALDLSRRLPERLWFPWNPLVTIYSEKRLYPVEDGLYVKQVTGRPEPREQTLSQLPPRFSGYVVAGTGSLWGLAQPLLPRPHETIELEYWTITRSKP